MELRVYKGRTLDDSIRLMRKAVMLGLHDAKTYDLVQSVIRECGARDDICEVSAWFNFLRDNTKYVADPRTIDQFKTLERSLQLRGLDCDDYSIALNTGLEAVGFETSFRVIQPVGASTWAHVYSLVHLPKRRPTGKVPLDLTLSRARPGVQPPTEIIVKFKDFPTIEEER